MEAAEKFLNGIYCAFTCYRKHGESFAKLSAAVMNKGPNLIILWEEGSKNVLGGFAMASWKAGPKFFGSNQNFLFNLKPRAYVYEASSFNENYQYMNVKAKTMPNGIGKIFIDTYIIVRKQNTCLKEI